MRIAIIGFGAVARAFVKLLPDKEKLLKSKGISLEIISIINSQGGVFNYNGLSQEAIGSLLINGFSKEQTDFSKEYDVDYIIENGRIDTAILLTPTNKKNGEPGLTYAKKLLNSKINVVSGDKGPALFKFMELRELSKKSKCNFTIGCTTGGALPSINVGYFDICGSSILSMKGILNGTSNFILTEMEKRDINFEAALTQAQELGIAENNPQMDIEGYDTAIKLVIIYNALTNNNKSLDDVDIHGITGITLEEIQQGKSQGYKYKLIGKIDTFSTDAKLSVVLEKVYMDSPIYNIDGRNKGILFSTDTLGDITVIGGASDPTAAAASLLRDIVNIERGIDFTIL